MAWSVFHTLSSLTKPPPYRQKSSTMAIYNIGLVLVRKLWTPAMVQFLLVIVVLKALFNITLSLKMELPWSWIRLPSYI